LIPLLIIAGYFRSGTTMLYYLAEKCNRGLRVLYEPDHEMLPYYVVKNRGWVNIFQPIKIRTYECYSKLSDDEVSELLRKHRINNCPFSLGEIGEYVDFLNRVADVIKVNRWTFILDEIIDKYDAKVVYIVRNVYDVVASHLVYYEKTGDPNIFGNVMYYRRLKQRYNVTAKDIVERVTVNWFITNTYAYKLSLAYPENMFIVRYDDIVVKPYILREIEEFSGIRLTCENIVRRRKHRLPEDVKQKIRLKLRQIKAKHI